MIITSIIAGLGAYYLSHSANKGPVFGSAAVTLIAGILFTILDYYGLNGAIELAAVAATAGYAGMVSKKYVVDLVQMAILSTITAVIFLMSENLFVGIGGRLGTMAAISCFVFIGFKKIINHKSLT